MHCTVVRNRLDATSLKVSISKVHLFSPYALDQGSPLSYDPRGSRQHAFTTMEESCCTCAQLLKNVFPHYDEKSEKPKAVDRRLDCCGRIICGNCIADNLRFQNYCRMSFMLKRLPPLTEYRPFLSSLDNPNSVAPRPPRPTFIYATVFLEALTCIPRSASIFRRASLVLISGRNTDSTTGKRIEFTVRRCTPFLGPRTR
jgi:hypothetical protein